MKCKRFSVAKRDTLLSKLQLVQLNMGQCASHGGFINEQQVEYFVNKLQECIDLVDGSLSK